MERTLVLVKPDGVQRGLVGEIIGRFERKGLKVVGLRLMPVPRDLAERHYAVHAGKHFYAGLVEFITSGPVAAVAVEGPDAIAPAASAALAGLAMAAAFSAEATGAPYYSLYQNEIGARLAPVG